LDIEDYQYQYQYSEILKLFLVIYHKIRTVVKRMLIQKIFSSDNILNLL